MKKLIILAIVTLLISEISPLKGQNISDNLKTIQLSSKSHRYTPFLKWGEVLEVSFDDLDADQKDYYYRIRHMNFDWSPSLLRPSEYISGYQRDRIRNFENSQNTLQFYTHYKFSLPNQNTQITRTGNYLIEILDDYDEVVVSRRISIYQEQVVINANVFKSREIQYINSKQAVQFQIYYPNIVINEPKRDLKVVLMKNGDWSSKITNLKPQYLKKQELSYKYDKEASFFAGNEYLNFDSKYLRTSNSNINEVRLGPLLYQTILYPNIDRSKLVYTYFPDINGGFQVQMNNARDSELSADYTEVHFQLNIPELKDEEIHITGAYNNFHATDENKMFYNKEINAYQAQILFKQGFYNYEYRVQGALNHQISGDFYQTENEYQVLVYYQPFGNRYYEIIGLGQASSVNLKN
ncbi:MAG: DUF5103 domain-containing protein [Flavobacteriaceae bacterium]